MRGVATQHVVAMVDLVQVKGLPLCPCAPVPCAPVSKLLNCQTHNIYSQLNNIQNNLQISSCFL